MTCQQVGVSAEPLREVRVRHDKFWLWRTNEWKLAWLSGDLLVIMGETYRFSEGDFDDSPAIPLHPPALATAPPEQGAQDFVDEDDTEG